MNRPLFYTTQVPARQTVTDCQSLLVQAGAYSVAVMYADKTPTGLLFELDTLEGKRAFQMPVNWAGVLALLQRTEDEDGWPPSVTRADRKRMLTAEHAQRVAWRVVRSWLEAQLSLIDAQMVTVDQVMLPYMLVAKDTTLYQRYLEDRAIERAQDR